MPGRVKGRRRTLRTGLLVVVTVAIGWFVVEALVAQWAGVRLAVKGANLAFLALAMLLATAAMMLIADGWHRTLRLLDADVPGRSLVHRWYFVGEAGKYLPGGVWPLLGRGEMARKRGVPRSVAYGSVLLSLAALYLSGLLVCGLLLPFVAGDGSPGPWGFLVLLVPVGFVALRPQVIVAVLHALEALTRRSVDLPILPWRSSVGLVLSFVPVWALVAAANWCTARALTPDVPVVRVGFASVLGWCAGFFAVPIPSGLGVREAVMGLSSGLPDPLGPVTAVLSRFIFTVIDVAAAGACALALRTSPPDGGSED